MIAMITVIENPEYKPTHKAAKVKMMDNKNPIKCCHGKCELFLAMVHHHPIQINSSKDKDPYDV